jgi:hypothetical protein
MKPAACRPAIPALAFPVMRNAPLLTLLFAVLAAACAPAAPVTGQHPDARPAATSAPDARRAPAIVVSIDALSERTIRETLDATAAPTLHGMFDGAACALGVRPAMPSVTAAGHAAIWTGAFGDVSGISANNQPRLPYDSHDLLDLESGFSAGASRAEPIWISAGLAGLRVAGHHVTQAPQEPGYRPLRAGSDEPHLDVLRARARAINSSPQLAIVNGYDVSVAPHRALTETTHPLRPARGWTGVEWLPPSPPPLEMAFAIGEDSVFALVYGDSDARPPRYTRMVVTVGRRDGSRALLQEVVGRPNAPVRAVELRPTPADTAWPRRDALARHFSLPLVARHEGSEYPVSFRLFALAGDGSTYLLYHPSVQAIAGNRSGLGRDYLLGTSGGWIDNAATTLYGNGSFGQRYDQGGDGTAEARWLETAQLMTRQSIAGSEWMWRNHTPDLQVDYFALGDNTDHRFFGWIDRASPSWNDAHSPRFQEVRRRAWALVDMRVAALADLAASRGGALFVTGDHGMRAVWRAFRPNALLRDAGLLAADTAGRIDLSASRAVSPNGYWIAVNRASRRGGIVAESDVPAVIAAAERALRDARGPDGQPIITRIFRASEHDTLGIGGPVGGDIYFETAPGYSWSSSARGTPSGNATPFAGHGYPSVASDMQTAFCAISPTIAARRIGPMRLIDVAPTVSEWLGIAPPATSQGRSVLGPLLGR